jgi:plasmid maintenance system antidote protein VapI
MNPLAKFFDAHPERRKSELAEFIEVDKTAVSKILADTRDVTVAEAFLIEEWTGGEVKAREWAKCA